MKTPVDKEVRSIAMASGHGLLLILAHVHNKTAIEYLEKILAVCQSSKNEDFAFAAAQSLILAKKLISIEVAGGS